MRSAGVRRQFFFLALLLIVLVQFGTPYAALLLDRAMGPMDGTLVEHDGSLTHIRFDPALPRPAFVPVFPGAAIVEASLLVSKAAPAGVGRLKLAAHGSLDAVRAFYRAQFEAAGFTVEDHGTLGLNPAAADYLGVAGALAATRPATDDVVTVQIGTEEGRAVRSRLVTVSWRKLTDWPVGQPKP